jgi:predicted lipid-binding transport protein (Tim44 family)
VTDPPPQSAGAGYPGGMGRTILKILGGIFAIWAAFTAIGGIFAMVKTFVIIGLIAAVVVIVVWVLAKRARRD